MGARILVVDDERNIRRTLRMVLEGAGHEVREAESAEAALSALESALPDLVILDVKLPGMNGIDALATMRRRYLELPIIMVSGHASLAEAVHAVQIGAHDFLEKPLDRDRVLVSVRNVLRAERLEREVAQLRAEAADRYQMVGQSPVMRELYAALEKVAPTRGRVLITGESGTGKELIARAVHRLSDRAEQRFVMLNCAAIPADLIESELFGHERGAFTGAQGRKRGMFELADGGTLFLDEIGDMSLGAQAKVLRALQSGEISRVGGEQAIAVDVRVVAATNKDLEAEVASGRFREDLYFRLNVVPIRCPALSERVDDIPLLAKAFFEHFCREYGGRQKPVEAGVYAALQRRAWPGNVRELRNVVERMVILGGADIRVADVPGLTRADADTAAGGSFQVPLPRGEPPALRAFRDSAEAAYILAALEACEWNISRAAERLGVERTNLHKKMRGFGIRRDDAED